MTVNLSILGRRDEGDRLATRGGPPGAEHTPSLTDLFDDLEVVASFNLSRSARERADEPEVLPVEDDDILEFEVQGGFRIWTSARRFQEEVLLLRPDAKVGDAVSVDTLPRVSRRGITDWVQNRLRVLKLKRTKVEDILGHPDLWPSDLEELASELGIDLAVKLPAWFATKALMRTIEGRLRPGPGLYSWGDATRDLVPGEPDPEPARFDGYDVEKPMLVFLHGTASSTRGSFGAFLGEDAQPQWQALTQLFGDRIYAFEHRTISDSPIDNAIELVSALPPNARVSLVSHSRGGLVGDLLSLTSISSHLVARFDRKDPELLQADEHDRRQLERLAGLLAQKKLRVERFVRCAAPSRGTLLASENLDFLMSVLTNLVGLIPGLTGNPLYEVTTRIALEIIKNRTRPQLLPGLEAMVPESPLVGLLNNPETPANGALGIVAGDIEGGNWLKRLGVFANDQFLYESRDNDLVVNTDAMFHGARREVAGYVFDKGADVSHFNYFRNPRTRAALVSWLAAPLGEPAEPFLELPHGEVQPVPMLRSALRGTGSGRPMVFVLPGIMGSHLHVDDQEVWLNYSALLDGHLGDLADVDAASVQPVSLVGDGYRDLCEYLQDSHEVIPFAYDWRRSVTRAAGLLAVEVDDALRSSTQPVRIVAHGMGGLVVRAMIAERRDVWDRVCERAGARLVMLGTPNRGSHEAVEALLGTSAGIRQLALLDHGRDTADIAAIAAGYPGLLELLPGEPFFAPGHWAQSQWSGFAVPAAERLAAAKVTFDALATATTVIPHADRVHYVAGVSARTVSGVDLVKGRVVLSVTSEGDGRVTYESGQLPGVPMWFMQAVHGDLPSHPAGLPAIRELLEKGTTSRLPTVAPSVARGGAVTYRALPEPVLYPTETSLAAGILGKKPCGPYRRTEQPSFRVSVVHGDLRYARHPIMVGHYEGDTIIAAEAQVDAMLGCALSQRYSLGLYPGVFGSVAVVLRKPTPAQEALGRRPGAIVMGLGKWGELTAGQLGDLIRRAALQYLLELRNDLCGPSNGEEHAAKVGLSVLLVGGNSNANIAVGDSVAAILRAIAQVNRELASAEGGANSIHEVEIVELYADTAIEAAHAVKRLAPQIGKELQTRIEAAPLLQRGREGRRRLMSTTGRDAWRRWEVSVVTPPRPTGPTRLPRPLADRLKRAVVESGAADPELVEALAELAIGAQTDEAEVHREIRFLTLSDRARAEATSQQRQPELVERLIKDAISQPSFSQEESRVLFELTIPNELKSGLARVDNLVLVLDAESAAYPWELMSPGDKPLCLAKGLVRQLQTSSYRPQIGARAGTAAYVVGDPRVSPPFSQLDGAAAEADAVYELLCKRFDVKKPATTPTALQVLAGLYEKPYRIVHIAGHGHYEPPPTPDGKARSGVVLDNGVFLTAVEVGQMQQVPELVFLNCCHIGQTGPQAVPRTSGVEFNRLAASVSRELIEMGVRAVVAAGWAVDDVAAKLFAETFYGNMLDGETFGRALRAARDTTFDEHPDTNTWGAYQAYGDPDYRLDPTGYRTSAPPLGPVDAAEFIEAVRNVARRAAQGNKDAGGSLGASVRSLEELVDRCPTDWLGSTDVLMDIGYAFGELGRFDVARDYLAAALAGDGTDSTTTMRAVEELARYEACQADDNVDGNAETAVVLRRDAITRLEGLIALAPTAERYSQLGDVYTRRAVAEPDASDARTALTAAAESYRMAHQRNVDRQQFDPCPVLNWLAAAALLGKGVPGADILIDRCEVTASERFQNDRAFITAIGIAESALVRALPTLLGSDDDEAERVRAAYQKVLRETSPSAGELAAADKQLKIAGTVLGKLWTGDAAAEATIVRLAELRATIAGEVRVSS
ncbi:MULTISPECIES: CHAT domain-containing protein [unclassified Mycobacterium]|uniref:CHAT domain-containing protein n=1 Tax=unclassified Mycobacterium TaxID=2642494 RepID=UPI0029C628FC|nr:MULTISPECIES: CHAT domain-containing protein [unclassified Mycobacterium]